MPKPKESLREQAKTSLKVAIVFLDDGAFLDAARCASEAIALLLRAYGERFCVS